MVAFLVPVFSLRSCKKNLCIFKEEFYSTGYMDSLEKKKRQDGQPALTLEPKYSFLAIRATGLVL